MSAAPCGTPNNLLQERERAASAAQYGDKDQRKNPPAVVPTVETFTPRQPHEGFHNLYKITFSSLFLLVLLNKIIPFAASLDHITGIN